MNHQRPLKSWFTVDSLVALSFLLVLWQFYQSLSVSRVTSLGSHHALPPSDTCWKIPDQPDPEVAKNIQKGTNGLFDCNVTAQAQICVTSTGEWRLQSLDSQGQPKTIGGDEYYLTFHGSDNSTNPLSIAQVTDLENGSYHLDFVQSPRIIDKPSPEKKKGILQVHFEFTCGIGRMAPPSKESWLGSGASATHYVIQDVRHPRAKPFPVPPSRPNLENSAFTFFVGDSVMEQFMSYKRHVYVPKRIYFKRNVGMALNSSTVPAFLRNIKRWHGKELDVNFTLVLGSSTWDLLDPQDTDNDSFQDHRNAIRALIQNLRQLYPQVRLVWKAATAVHPHRILTTCLSNLRCSKRIRYLSQSRSRLLYDYQKEVIHDLHLDFMDIWHAYWAMAEHTLDGDGRHYDVVANRYVLQWFYPDTVIEQPELAA